MGIPERVPSKDKTRTDLNSLNQALKPGAGEMLTEERQTESEHSNTKRKLGRVSQEAHRGARVGKQLLSERKEEGIP